MQLTPIWALLLATLTPMIANVRSRASNDRIVFPGDTAKVNPDPSIATRSGSSESTQLPAVSDRIVFPKDEDDPKADYYNLSSSNSTLSTPSNITSSQPENLESPNGTELPDLGNRILLETKKLCPQGLSLHGGYCRKKV